MPYSEILSSIKRKLDELSDIAPIFVNLDPKRIENKTDSSSLTVQALYTKTNDNDPSLMAQYQQSNLKQDIENFLNTQGGLQLLASGIDPSTFVYDLLASSDIMDDSNRKKGKFSAETLKKFNKIVDFSVKYDVNNGTFSITSLDTINSSAGKQILSPGIYGKVLSRLKEFLERESGKKISISFKNIVINYLLQEIQKVPDASFQSLLKQELLLRQHKYDLKAADLSNLRGFLGEVWSNAAITYLTNGKKTTVPVGTLLSQGKEIPIDMYIEAMGDYLNFQIKNYKNPQNFRIYKTYQSIFTFLETLPSDNITDILLTIFATYQFNQPDDINASNSNGYAEYVGLYNNFKNQLAGNTGALTNILRGYLDRIINVTSEFQSTDIYNKFKEYRNTFFIISGRLIPSSAIIKAIIIILNSAAPNDQNLITFNVTSIGEPNTQSNRYNFSDPSHQYGAVNETRKNLADNISLKYKVTINWNEIEAIALSNI